LPYNLTGYQKATGFADPLLPVAKAQVQDFIERGGNIVKPLNINFLRSAKNQIETVAEKKSDATAVQLIRRLMQLPQDALGAVAARDPQLVYTAAECVAELAAAKGTEIDKDLANMQSFLSRMLVGDYAWLAKFALQAELLESNSNTATREDILAACGYFSEGFVALRDKLLSFAEIAYPPFAQPALQKIQKVATRKEEAKPDDAAAQHLKNYFIFLHSMRDKHFGNARAVRQVVGESVRNQHLRLAAMKKEERTPEIMAAIIFDDVKEFEIKEPTTTSRPVGFEIGKKK
ncbi:MAG: hypothetical protein ACOYXT_00560, partial [Bacteroidota bacterium]